MIDWSTIDHFGPDEFAGKMDPALVDMLDTARAVADVPFILTSTRRAGEGTSEHNTGHGVDIRCHGSHARFRILLGLLTAGFTRIGVYDLHIHAGNSMNHDQEVVWMGKSK